jgi:hypothetical protein
MHSLLSFDDCMCRDAVMQALLQAGAVEVACRLLQACYPAPAKRAHKRHKHEAGDASGQLQPRALLYT